MMQEMTCSVCPKVFRYFNPDMSPEEGGACRSILEVTGAERLLMVFSFVPIMVGRAVSPSYCPISSCPLDRGHQLGTHSVLVHAR